MYDLLIFVLTQCFIGCIIAIGAVFALYSPVGDIQGFDFMRGLGTLINVALLIFGGLCGLLFGKKLNERIKDTLLSVNAVAIMMLAVGGVMQNMLSLSDGKLSTGGTVMMIVSLTLGGLIGEIININALVDKFGEWLKIKSHSTGDDSFVSAFVSASCTVCIGAMAVIGSINDGVSGDCSVLIAKAILDAVIICVMTASQGKGCIFSAVPVAIFQGAITIIAVFVGGFMTDLALSYLSYVGNVLIFCVGLNLIRKKQIRVANLLPSLVIAVAWGFVAPLI